MGERVSKTNRVVMDVKVGEAVRIDGGPVTVVLREKSGRSRARLVLELNPDARVAKVPQNKLPETA